MNEKSKTKKLVINAMLLAIGAVLHQITPALGLLSAKLLVGLPALFTVLFTGVVLPTTVINLITGIFLFKIVLISLNRVSYSN